MLERKINKIPILSRIAKDILVILAFTIALKSILSAGKCLMKRDLALVHILFKCVFVRKMEIMRMSEHKESRTMTIKTMTIYG